MAGRLCFSARACLTGDGLCRRGASIALPILIPISWTLGPWAFGASRFSKSICRPTFFCNTVDYPVFFLHSLHLAFLHQKKTFIVCIYPPKDAQFTGVTQMYMCTVCYFVHVLLCFVLCACVRIYAGCWRACQQKLTAELDTMPGEMEALDRQIATAEHSAAERLLDRLGSDVEVHMWARQTRGAPWQMT